MSLLVVGSLAFDSVRRPTASSRTPWGLGRLLLVRGQLLHAGPVGRRRGRGLPRCTPPDARGTQDRHLRPDHREGRQDLSLAGKYEGDMNTAETLEVHLNVLGTFNPDLSPEFAETPFVFLANGSPTMQRKVLSQAKNRKLAVADTMNFWIETQRDELYALLTRDRRPGPERRRGADADRGDQPRRAGCEGARPGPEFVIIKKGEHGAMFLSHESIRHARFPRRPTSSIRPAPATASRAGFMGYLASTARPTPRRSRGDGLRHRRRQLHRRGFLPPPVPAHRSGRDRPPARRYRPMMSF